MLQNSHPGQINARPIWLFSTNSNGFVRVKGSHVDSLGLKDDESGKFIRIMVDMMDV